MSAAEERDPAPGGQDDPVGAAGARAVLAGAGGGVDHDPGPGGGPVAGPAGVAEAGVLGTLQATARALQEEEGEQEAAPARAQESGSAEEDSDIGPAEEEDEDLEGSMDVVVDARHFPMAGFRFMFLDLVHSLLHRIYYNHHILIRPLGGRVIVRQCPRTPEDLGEPPTLHVPKFHAEPPALWAPLDREEPAALWQREDPGEGPASWEAEGRAGENACACEPKELTEETVGPEGEERAEGSTVPEAQGGGQWPRRRGPGCPGADARTRAGAYRPGLGYLWPLSRGVMLAQLTPLLAFALRLRQVEKRRVGALKKLQAQCAQPVLFFTKEANKYQYENSDQEAQKAGGEEEKEAEEEKEKKNEVQEGPETDLNLAEGSPRKSRYI
ncbi:cancer/testis antigen 47B [Choloepus didactylus]|uniref:cancer/testis antigen 47B n=1 Tax=Choloepus didactylus TaxID=27675 RepID=UPI00189DCE96|nr:cancer/testis antigen 47B [Choloepus didactylus]